MTCISLIVAMARNRVIGINNQLPWHLPADLRHFKQLTLHKPVIMGRTTFESIGKPLPERLNIILTHNKNYQQPGCVIVHSLDQALLATANATEVMIMGGAKIYQQTFSLAHRLYLTQIDADFKGDSFFPEWNANEWQEIAREDHQADEKNAYDFSFVVLEKIFS